MTPRPFSAQVVTMRLALMRELLDDLEAIGAVDAQRLTEERLTRRALERVLTQLIDLAVDINTHVATTQSSTVVTEYRASFDAAAAVGLIDAGLAERLGPSVALRNVLVHEYLVIDLSIVAASAPLAQEGYGEYVRRVAAWLRDR